MLRIGKRLRPILVLLTFATSAATAQEWEYLGLPGKLIYSVVVRNADTMLVGAVGYVPTVAGVYRSTSGGGVWNLQLAANVSVLKVDPSNPNIYYAGFTGTRAPYGIKKTTDGGLTWFDADDGIFTIDTNVGAIEIDPSHPETLYASTGGPFGGDLYKTTNGGSHWDRIAVAPGIDQILSIAIHPETTSMVYAGSLYPGDLFRSTDGGISWKVTGLQGVGVRTVTLDPIDPQVIYVGAIYDERLYKTTDGGDTWTPSNKGLPPQSSPFGFVVNAATRDVVVIVHHVVADSAGLFVSKDIGESWSRMDGPTSARFAFALAYSPDYAYLYVGTQDSGLYRSSLTTEVVEKPRDALPSAVRLLQNYPNPFNPATTIKYTLPVDANVSLSVYDLLGREVVSLVDGFVPAGYHQISLDASNLASGVYFYKLVVSGANSINAGTFTDVKKLLLLK